MADRCEFRPRHAGYCGFFGAREECLGALEQSGCGDMYGDDGEHHTLLCEECEQDYREMSNSKRTVTVTVSADTSYLGDDATADDLAGFTANVCADIEAQFEVSVLQVHGSSSRGFTCDDPEINAWLQEMSDGDRWHQYLP